MESVLPGGLGGGSLGDLGGGALEAVPTGPAVPDFGAVGKPF